MSPEQERRYARLLRLYPKAYRDERGAEMLATLAEADRPTGRETVALIVGALRARAGLARLASPGRLWLSALRLSVLLLVAHATAQSAAYAGGVRLGAATELGHLGALVTGALALVALAAGRYRWGLALSAGAFAFGQWALSWLLWENWGLGGEFWQLPLAMVLTVPLLRRRPPGSARPWAWLLAVPLGVLLLPGVFAESLGWQPYAGLAVVAAALVWSAIDARVAIAVGALCLAEILPLLRHLTAADGADTSLVLPYLAAYGALAVVLVAAGALLTPRQARL